MKEIICSFCKTLFTRRTSNKYGSEMWIEGVTVVILGGLCDGHRNGSNRRKFSNPRANFGHVDWSVLIHAQLP